MAAGRHGLMRCDMENIVTVCRETKQHFAARERAQPRFGAVRGEFVSPRAVKKVAGSVCRLSARSIRTQIQPTAAST